jgi:hypothetical protein
MRGLRFAGRLLAALFVAALSLAGCTTAVRPVQCTGGPYRCHENSGDVMFCENEAVALEGSDCAAVGLAPSKHFCVVVPQPQSCASETHYEVKDRDCKVLRYRALREWRECSPETPTFAP